MRRSLGAVATGWVMGFCIAIAWSATRVNNPRLAPKLSAWAIAGMVVIGVLLISVLVRDRTEARRDTATSVGSRRDFAGSPQVDEEAARAAVVAEKRSAARIAELEGRLAHEQEELDAAVASLAATELAETGRITGGMGDPDPGPVAADLEPLLRQEVVDVVAELVGGTQPADAAAIAKELEARLENAR